MTQDCGDGGLWRLAVQAGPRARVQVPVAVDAPPDLPDGGYRLEGDGPPATGQVCLGQFCAILPHVPAGQTRSYAVRPHASGPSPDGVAVSRSGDAVVVRIGDQDFTTLRLQGAPKPFLHPLLAPGGRSVVRGWPVLAQPGDSSDHPHHRGVWVGHGSVNGMDAWEERPGRVGAIVADEVVCGSGPVCGVIGMRLRWLLPDARAVATERRTYRFWNLDGQARLFDQESVYEGVEGAPVRFGDTKEGALCGLRVAAGMEGQAGGRIRTAEGAIGEREAWGSAAGWCDYSGEPRAGDTDGRSATIGVAIFDHPANPLHPTRWHVRDYGLMAANPFALSHYLPGRGLRGDWDIPAGARAVFRFRICVHVDDAEGAEIPRRYADFAFPARLQLQRT